MLIFFEVLLDYESNPNYNKLREDICEKVLKLHSTKEAIVRLN